MQHFGVSAETLNRVQECLIDSEQIVWTGRPEPVIKLDPINQLLYGLSAVCLPLFVAAFVFGLVINNRLILLATILGIVLTGAMVLATRTFRRAPVLFEEYVLTNRRAFSHFRSNGTSILGSMPLDAATSIKSCRASRGCTSLMFRRQWHLPPAAPENHRTGKQPEAFIGFVNLKDSDNPMKIAQWAASQNKVPA